MSSKVILSLDVSSSSTGYAILRNGRWRGAKNSYGKVCISPKLPISERLVYFRDEIELLINKTSPDLIVIEDIFSQRNISTLKLLARFNGVAIEVSHRCTNKSPLIALTSQVRGFLKCGRSKEEAFKFICQKYKLEWNYNDMNDVTDAIALALYAASTGKI